MLLLFLNLTSVVLLVSAAGEEAPVITTEEGKISGIVEKAINGRLFYSYNGIPFALPPVGELRFKDPVASGKWQGVRDGSSIPPPCLQILFTDMLVGKKIALEDIAGDEDCLYLNVYTPKVANTKGDLPVMMFIHGGGFFAGAANEYEPHVLLSKDIVLVMIQYRLGYLGFMSTEDSTIPGNYGMKDQTLALQWIQRNIRNFGGNPQKVTIFGESAGGASVHYHMLTPKSKGLFNGVIMQSGTAICPWGHSMEHKKTAKEVGLLVGCSLDKGSHEFLRCMQSVSAVKITATIQDLSKWFVFPLTAVPRVDGDYIPEEPAKLMKEGSYNKVNLMAGITSHEGAEFVNPVFFRDDLQPALENNFPVFGPISLQWNSPGEDLLKLSMAVYDYYLGGVNIGREYADDFVKLMSDQHFNVPHDLVSEIHAREPGLSTFRYELTYRGDLSIGDIYQNNIGHHWVSHADDLLYLFRGGPLPPEEKPLMELKNKDDLAVRDIMVSLWTNFAAKGNPTPDNSLGFIWDATSTDSLRHLDISRRPFMAADSRKKIRKFLGSLPTKINRILNPDLVKQRESAAFKRAPQDEL